jgi:hypothetical protein
MQINNFAQKVDIIRQYRAATVQEHLEVAPSVNAQPAQVEVGFDGKKYDFALAGTEMAKLLSEFNVRDLGQLFSR